MAWSLTSSGRELRGVSAPGMLASQLFRRTWFLHVLSPCASAQHPSPCPAQEDGRLLLPGHLGRAVFSLLWTPQPQPVSSLLLSEAPRGQA